MSGHSKWATIKHHKGAADAKKAAVFTKLAYAVTMAAKTGGGDPEFNFTLRLAVDKARASNMPKDNIERAIKKGTGELAGEQIVEIIYEGFGPGNSAVVIESVTDNKNRAVSNIKHAFLKNSGTLGGPNSVMWMFDKFGVIRIAQEDFDVARKDEFELACIDAGAQDIKFETEGVSVFTQPTDLKKIKDAVEALNFKISHAEFEYVPKEHIKISDEDQTALETFFSDLDELEDVNNYYTNVG